MGNHIHLRVPIYGLVRPSKHLDYKAPLTLLTVGATDQGFIPDAIKAAKDIGYKVIRLVLHALVSSQTNILSGLQLGS